MGGEPCDQFIFGHEPGDTFLDLAAFEEQQGRDAHHAKLHDKIGVLVCIDLYDLDLPIPLASQLL